MLAIPTIKELEILNQYYERNSQNAAEINPELPEITAAILFNDGTLAGSISLYDITRESAKWGISIIDNRGILLVATSAKRFLKDAFEKIGVKKIYCEIRQSNKHAITSALRAGFFMEKDGDPIVFSMDREQFEARCRKCSKNLQSPSLEK